MRPVPPRTRAGRSSPGCMFALVLLVVIGGWLGLRGRGRDTRADRASKGRWGPERAAAYAHCETLTRERLARRGLAPDFPQVDPTTRAASSDGRTFFVQSTAEVRLAGGVQRMPYQCVLERDPASASGWTLVGGSAD